MIGTEKTNLGTLSLKKLQSFLAVARTSSFRRAAESLNRSQPAVSIQIDGLEKDLGVRLFRRTTRRVTLTEEGAALFAHVEVALNEISDGLAKVSSMAGRKADKICISCAPTISSHLLASILQQFRSLHPDVDIELREAVLDAMRDDLRTGVADLGIGPEFPDDPDLVQQRVFVDEIVAVLPAGSPFASGGKVPLRAFADQPLLVSGPATALWKTIESAFSTAGVSPVVLREVVHNESLIGMVRAGLGMTFLPRYFAEISRSDHFVVCRVCEPPIYRNICMVTKTGVVQPPAVRSFGNLVLEQMPVVLAEILETDPVGRPDAAGKSRRFASPIDD